MQEPQWGEAIAAGRRSFVARIQQDLGPRARYRRIEEEGGVAVLRDADGAYTRHVAGAVNVTARAVVRVLALGARVADALPLHLRQID